MKSNGEERTRTQNTNDQQTDQTAKQVLQFSKKSFSALATELLKNCKRKKSKNWINWKRCNESPQNYLIHHYYSVAVTTISYHFMRCVTDWLLNAISFTIFRSLLVLPVWSLLCLCKLEPNYLKSNRIITKHSRKYNVLLAVNGAARATS